MVSVGDEDLLVGEGASHRGREVRVGDRPQDALDPVGVYGGRDRLGGRRAVEELIGHAGRIVEQAEDLAQVRARWP